MEIIKSSEVLQNQTNTIKTKQNQSNYKINLENQHWGTLGGSPFAVRAAPILPDQFRLCEYHMKTAEINRISIEIKHRQPNKTISNQIQQNRSKPSKHKQDFANQTNQ